MRRGKKREIRRWRSEKYSHATSLWIRALWVFFGVGMFELLLARLAILMWQSGDALVGVSAQDILRMFWMGMRFDAKVVATLLFPLLFFPLLYSFTSIKYPGRWARILWIFLSTSLLWSVALVSVVDYYYFSFFRSHFDLHAWGFWEDDTSAVLHSIWTDFPVIRVGLLLLLLAIVLVILFAFLLHTPYRAKYPSYWAKRMGWVFLLFAIFFFLARGTLSTFPLSAMHLTVSTHPFLNKLTNNGPFALYRVLAHSHRSSVELSTDNILKRWGFSSEEQAIEAYTNSSVVKKPLFSLLVDSTACNDSLALTPPHVVVLQMESMGSYYMHFDHGAFDLLGTLKEELPYLYLFPNAFSTGSGTLASLEALLFGVLQGSVGQSPYFQIPLSTSVARVYQESGYHTSYISGQRLGWRNISNFLPYQYFDRIEGDVDLQTLFSTLPSGTWGMHDEALFARIVELLASAKKPQFVYGMSISHHTPYDTPYIAYQETMQIPDSVAKQISGDPEVARKSFLAFRYQSDHLGRFLKTIRTSPLAENTIVVFTGDHTLKQNLSGTDNPKALYGVPIAFYIPPRYRNFDSVDLQQYISHNDIFPTLFHLSLSGAKYFKTGGNIFAKDPKQRPRAAIYDQKFVLNRQVYVHFDGSVRQFLGTAKDSVFTAEYTDRLLDSVERYGRGYYAALLCFLAHELKGDLPVVSYFQKCEATTHRQDTLAVVQE